ncbi:MAG TPA: hypothetical protein VFL73_12475 [Solirubrobacteraceae bacterium]|jgi:hypothetical protein|nr:hypothetical protein [Solirubrobacteraceae bacterium]
MKLRIAIYVIALGVALGVVMGSLFSFSPDAAHIRLLAAGCSLVLAFGLVLQLRHTA